MPLNRACTDLVVGGEELDPDRELVGPAIAARNRKMLRCLKLTRISYCPWSPIIT